MQEVYSYRTEQRFMCLSQRQLAQSSDEDKAELCDERECAITASLPWTSLELGYRHSHSRSVRSLDSLAPPASGTCPRPLSEQADLHEEDHICVLSFVKAQRQSSIRSVLFSIYVIANEGVIHNPKQQRSRSLGKRAATRRCIFVLNEESAPVCEVAVLKQETMEANTVGIDEGGRSP